ncbi:hypothetical protein LL974_03820 [Xanthomonas campestris pv. cannae]|nr:hypothetical protein [Xanthomonas campestris pv. cannae]
MDLRASLADAQIVRVAIVDDDLSGVISTGSLRQVDDNLEALLVDVHDPDRQAYLQVLKDQGYDLSDIADLAHPLSEQSVRDAAPEVLRSAAEKILEARRDSAEPVDRVRKLLTDSGIDETNIETFFGPDMPDDKRFDLVIVDYYLVNDATDQTVPFIERIVHNHAEQERPLQLILMSSHEEGLKQDFRKLRPRVGVSSSRMRILAKPQNDAQLAAWKLTLEQLAMDRGHVSAIELFVGRAIGAIRRATDEQSRKLWELDLQAMKVLHETAKADNDDFSRYVEECLSRYLLTRLEEIHDLRDALESLRDSFGRNGGSTRISAGAEIGDSRAAIREIMTSMVWRGGGSPIIPAMPANPADAPRWVQQFLRFGMVIRDSNGRLWLNLTQSCDLAQTKAAELAELPLLLIGGHATNPTVQGKPDNATIRMTAPMVGAEPDLISWQLQRVSTPSVADFAAGFGNGWMVVGELRLDQAQSVVASYGAQVTRVGLQLAVRSWGMRGVAMSAGALNGAIDGSAVTGFAVAANALIQDKECEIHFELSTYNALQDHFPGEIDDAALRLCSGVAVKPGKTSQGEPYLVHCEAAPTTVEQLRALLNNKQWLERAQNANKVIVAVWPA